MRLLGTSIVVSALTLAVPLTAFAQICRGSVPLAGSRGNVSAGVSFFEGGRTLGGGVTLGSALFGSASYSRSQSSDGLDVDAVGASIGREFSPAESRASLCPVLEFAYTLPLDVGGAELTTYAGSVGMGFGYRTEIEPGVFVVPSAEVSVVRDHTKADAGSQGTNTENDTYATLTIGLGFLMNEQRVSLAPSVEIPIGASGGSAVLGVGLALAFGGR